MRQPPWPKHRILMILLASSLLLLRAEALSEQLASITLRDGTVYDLVLYLVNESDKTISLVHDETEKTIGFLEVRSIVDVNGQDLTYSVLGSDTERAIREAIESKNVSLPEQESGIYWALGTNVGVNYCKPSGDYYEGAKSGIGFDGEFVVKHVRKGAVKASISKAGIKGDSESLWFIDVASSDLYELHDLTISAYRVFLCLEGYRIVNIIDAHPSYLTIEIGTGVVVHKFGAELTRYEYMFWNDSYTERSTVEFSDRRTRFATTAGVGITQEMQPGLGLYARFNWDLVYLRGSWLSDLDPAPGPTFAHHFSLRCGLSIFF